LKACESRTYCGVHDGARPLVTPALIESTIVSARAFGTGIAATKVVDTIKEANEDKTVVRTVDRTKLWAVQTPQTVKFSLAAGCVREGLGEKMVVTDEAAAVELLGEKGSFGRNAVSQFENHHAIGPGHCRSIASRSDMTTRHIVAMGGGGFSKEPRNPLLDEFIFGLSGKRRPKVCFVGTASGDSEVYIERFYRAMRRHKCTATHLDLISSEGI
jgi:hypothetical protein